MQGEFQINQMFQHVLARGFSLSFFLFKNEIARPFLRRWDMQNVYWIFFLGRDLVFWIEVKRRHTTP
jgi:hypothetical protein